MPEFLPDLVHAHDWQAGLAPAYLRYYGDAAALGDDHPQPRLPGLLPGRRLRRAGAAAAGLRRSTASNIYGGVGYLKAGLANASAITTVSPTYAEEIRTPAFGMGLDGLIAARAGALHGIVNGIDTEVWNPETDPLLAAPFSAEEAAGPRRQPRRGRGAVRPATPTARPLFVLVSRLTWQKGIDLLAWITAPGHRRAPAKLAVLGTGDAGPRDAPSARSPPSTPAGSAPSSATTSRSRTVMQGGGDAILIPSRFEPCGLTQLYGLRYGCVPVVARVGGLADTVIDANVAALNAGVATGFQFTPVDAAPLAGAIRRAAALMRDRADLGGDAAPGHEVRRLLGPQRRRSTPTSTPPSCRQDQP